MRINRSKVRKMVKAKATRNENAREASEARGVFGIFAGCVAAGVLLLTGELGDQAEWGFGGGWYGQQTESE
ncbi:hypothetical protein BGZ63DRAFT_114981 [Mariannaea sp. PMI_226]|nr:hypothetical protein BGZ63DRAFT_114981 [Mariannaea sp. PMI_226]